MNVTVWSENFQERTDDAVKAVYPNGIYGCIAEFLSEDKNLNVRTATLDMDDQGLPEEVLETTDVLVWWAHCKHDDVDNALAERIARRVGAGMGIIFLHSSHFAKPFVKLMGTSGCLKWYEDDKVYERLWCANPAHPIAKGVDECVYLPHEEMYGEPFDIPAPDENIFMGWFSTGHLFRSGNIWNRGRGKVFYFQPGHETFPIYKDPNIVKIIRNAVAYVAPTGDIVYPECPHAQPLEA